MAEISKNCWIIAAGDRNRSYADICVRNSVVIMGPGDDGDFSSHAAYEKYSSKHGSAIANALQRFHQIGVGDLVILRLGLSEIHALGYVVNKHINQEHSSETSYGHSEVYSDIDGWDLQHFQQVRWFWKANGNPKIFNKVFSRGGTIHPVTNSEKHKKVLEWVKKIRDDKAPILQIKHKEKKEISVQDITSKLFNYGIGTGAISEVDEKISDLCRLARWYKENKISPSEAETVAHLVTPLLLSLGWSPQRIALEYNIQGAGRADIVLFPNGNRKDYQPTVVVEAKRYDQSCLSASEQIRRYASELDYVRRLIVTDGIRYGIFTRKDKEETFSLHLTAYLNLSRLRDCYPAYHEHCGGADEAILMLSSDWSHRFNAP